MLNMCLVFFKQFEVKDFEPRFIFLKSKNRVLRSMDCNLC